MTLESSAGEDRETMHALLPVRLLCKARNACTMSWVPLLTNGEEGDMVNNKVAEMTQTEFKEMLETVIETTVEEKLLEILGDPDDGLDLREAVRDRLIRQRKAVVNGQYGQPLEELVGELGLE